MFYAVQEESIVRSVIGDSLYNVIRTKTGVEPGMSHHYYEIMRADTSSAATVERYRQLSIEYYEHFEHIKDAEPARTYSMSVDATKSGDALTRALALNGNTINATWATNEHVYVQGKLRSSGSTFWYKGDIQPQIAGTTTQLNGTINVPDGWVDTSIQDAIDHGVINYPLEINLQFPRSGELDYTGQVGTLEDIAAKYDYAIATNVLFDIIGDHIVGTDKASFENQQAIVKFTLKDQNGNAINASSLTISAEGLIQAGSTTGTITITPASPTSIIFAALRGIASTTVTLSATCADGTYTYTKSGVTFTNGNYYDITVKMTKQ
jgi:hypothetical protein